MNIEMILTYVFAGLLGLCVGSFLNVVIYRVPNGMSVAFPPSHCPNCDYKLKWYDNIPVLSYLILGAKCRSCKQPISFRYTAVELLNALFWLGAVWLFWEQSVVYAIVVALASSVLVCIAFIDLEHQLIFDRFNLSLLVLAIVAVFFDKQIVWYERLIGFGVGAVFFVGVYYLAQLIFKKEALGGGDVKLGAVMGLLLGWKAFLLSMLVATVLASVVLLILQKATHGQKGKEYPFAPFLVLGCLVGLFFGNEIVSAYVSLLGGV